MMTLARDSRGLTQTELACCIGVKQGTVSKYEAGLLEPPADFINELASALGYAVDFFFQTGRPYGMPPFHYRRRKKLGVKPLSKIIAEMNIRRIHLDIFLRSYDMLEVKKIPEIDRDEYRGGHGKAFSVEDIARHLRECWLVPDGPIENVIDLIEGNGGFVIACNFESDLIDAVSQRIDGMPVLFFVNMNAPADRIRYTLCHELGHMVLHTTTILEDEEMEVEADRFAGAFLMPAMELRSQLQWFDLRQVANLKRYWKVSMAAITMRAFHLGLITPHQKKVFFIQMSKSGYRIAEPHEPPKEYPRKVRGIISYFVSVLGYTKAELAKTLFVSEGELDRLYSFGEVDTHSVAGSSSVSHLRVVK